jgi:glycerophosphoryl diester phosphodiesterase
MVEHSSDPHSKTVKFNIETKIFADHPEYTTSPEDFVSLFYKIVKSHHMEKRVVLQSFDYRTLTAMRALDPKIVLSALVEKGEGQSSAPDLVAIAKETKADILSPDSSLITKENVKALHAMNVQVHPWTVNTPEEWQRLISLGVDGIISDDPQSLITFLKEKHLR